MGAWMVYGVAWALALLLLAPGEAWASRLRTRYVGTVNLNEATVAELDLLPGVGPAAAQRLVEQRKKRRFQRVEEVVRVKGFGRKKFLKLKPYLAVTGPTTLKMERVVEPAVAPKPAEAPPAKEAPPTLPAPAKG